MKGLKAELGQSFEFVPPAGLEPDRLIKDGTENNSGASIANAAVYTGNGTTTRTIGYDDYERYAQVVDRYKAQAKPIPFAHPGRPLCGN
jgi:hypothetical protein